MKKEELHQWLKALGYALIVFTLFSIYLYLRRGYYNLYIVNKVFGSTAVVVSAFTLIIGPLHRKFARFAHFMGIRKELGLVALGSAAIHVIASLMLQDHFKIPDYYLRIKYPLIFGIIAISTWTYMTYISRSSKIKQMGAGVWKKRLSLCGKIAFLAIFLHLTVMKYQGWITWFKGQTKQTPELANPQYPPASLFVLAIMLSVIFYRLINDFVHRNSDKEPQVDTPPPNPQGLPPAEQA